MSPLFQIGERRLAEIAAETRAPNVLTFTKNKAVRRREADRLALANHWLAEYRRTALALALSRDSA